MDRLVRESLSLEYISQILDHLPRADEGDALAIDAIREIRSRFFDLNRIIADSFARKFSVQYRLPIDDCQAEAYAALYRAILSIKSGRVPDSFGGMAGQSIKNALISFGRRERKACDRFRPWSTFGDQPFRVVAPTDVSTVETRDSLDFAEAIVGRIGPVDLKLFREVREGKSWDRAAECAGVHRSDAGRRLRRDFRVLRRRLFCA